MSVKVWPFTLIVPVLAGFPGGFSDQLKLIAPSPLPLGALVIAIHGAFDVAVHEQLPLVVIEKLLVPAAADTSSDAGASVYVQASPAAWFNVNVCPFTLIVPLRGPLPIGFSAKEKLTVPLPAPPGGPMMDIHPAFDTAVHGHVATVDTAKLPVPAVAGTSCVAGASA